MQNEKNEFFEFLTITLSHYFSFQKLKLLSIKRPDLKQKVDIKIEDWKVSTYVTALMKMLITEDYLTAIMIYMYSLTRQLSIWQLW